MRINKILHRLKKRFNVKALLFVVLVFSLILNYFLWSERRYWKWLFKTTIAQKTTTNVAGIIWDYKLDSLYSVDTQDKNKKDVRLYLYSPDEMKTANREISCLSPNKGARV